ncbi:MAG TPA: methionine synthase [Streptosporangiaceae bacterium]|nr:methionine synthase [Streptosporangiaceae bacterium]
MTSQPPPFPQPPSGQLRFAWPPGSASGAGSMPGTDPLQAVRIVLDELPALPYLPELPARGPGADLVGRTAALLTGLPVETTPSGWRLALRPGRDLSRARAMLASDLDTLEEAAEGYQGPLKVQLCGPWTLAAALELPASQDVALADHGAVSDLIQSLAESAAAHIADVGRRVPGAQLLLQLDEPSLPAVLAGAVPTASGLRRLAAVGTGDATEGLRAQFESTGADGIVHCCAGRPPFEVLTKSGARAIYIDLSLLRREDEDPLAEAAEAGLGLFAGAVTPGHNAPGHNERGEAEAIATRVIDLWRRLGLPAARTTGQVVIAPACGLAGVSPERAAAVLRACAEAARTLPEMIQEGSA